MKVVRELGLERRITALIWGNSNLAPANIGETLLAMNWASVAIPREDFKHAFLRIWVQLIIV